jgi:hypothetical protein
MYFRLSLSLRLDQLIVIVWWYGVGGLNLYLLGRHSNTQATPPAPFTLVRQGLVNVLPRLALNPDPPNLCLLSR